jgi:hypothetical protein
MYFRGCLPAVCDRRARREACAWRNFPTRRRKILPGGFDLLCAVGLVSRGVHWGHVHGRMHRHRGRCVYLVGFGVYFVNTLDYDKLLEVFGSINLSVSKKVVVIIRHVMRLGVCLRKDAPSSLKMCAASTCIVLTYDKKYKKQEIWRKLAL